MRHELKRELIHIWQEQIAPVYRAGAIINERTLETELYRHLQGGAFPPRQVWMAPKLQFSADEGVVFDHLTNYRHKQWLRDQRPTILISQDDMVIGVLEAIFSPEEYADTRRKMRRMMFLHQLGGHAEIALQINPHTGQLDSERMYRISDELLCIFAVITKSGAFGLHTQTLLKEFHDIGFQSDFLHLTASIRPEKIIFAFHSPEFK